MSCIPVSDRFAFIDFISEAAIKVIDVEDIINVSILHGHNDVVRKVTWEPSGSFLVRPCYSYITISIRLTLAILL